MSDNRRLPFEYTQSSGSAIGRLIASSPGWVLRGFVGLILAGVFVGGLDCRGADRVRVYVLAGQSNMEGKAKLSLLETQSRSPATREMFARLVDSSGSWVERDDVWIQFLDRWGPLRPGFGSPDRFGPELGFGWVLGEHFDEPVLLIKAAWGGKSLYRDFRPPSSGLPDSEVLRRMLSDQRKKDADVTLEDIEASFGRYFRLMIQEVKSGLEAMDTRFPELRGYEPELCGFVWFQGWNDMINTEYTAEYATNLENFIRDVRVALDVPEMPVVIGQLGVGGVSSVRPNEGREAFKAAQAEPAADPEFRDSVALVKTDQYWDEAAQSVFDKGWRERVEEWETVGSDYPFHYLGSAKTFLWIGEAFGEAMIDLEVDASESPRTSRTAED